MLRSTLMILAICVLIATPVLSAEPVVSKSIFAESGAETVLLVKISGADKAIFGINLADDSGSITDIYAPKGWVGISTGDEVMFRTGDKPIAKGSTVTFRIVTTNKAAPLGVTFRDRDSSIHVDQNI